MNASIRTIARGGITSTALAISLIAASPTSAVGGEETTDNAAVLTAIMAHQAAVLDANADFWEVSAMCIQDSKDEAEKCIAEAEEERTEALAFAYEQLLARIALIPTLGAGVYDPNVDEDDFTSNVTNKYFPLKPGRTLVYEKMTDEGLERIEVTTLNETFEIDDVICRAVRDVVYLDDVPVEDTTDWYAQDKDGNVWYFGEVSQNFEDGVLDNLDGSWRAGKEDAEPGIQMLTAPAVGVAYRQEFLVNEAEDYAIVLGTNETVVLSKFGRLHNCIKTLDGTPLEPGHIEHKYYAADIGFVLEIDPDTGERLELVEIIDNP